LCQKEASIEKWKEQLEKLEPMKCESCQGLVKPDIVFFGEQLPKDFFEGPEIVKEADLVLIIGTSMAVAPFSFLGTMVKETCPLVLINNQDSVPYRKDKLWLKGDIQDDIQKIMKDLDWL
jgi:NAD-dependent histone deacetylase SIR2